MVHLDHNQPDPAVPADNKYGPKGSTRIALLWQSVRLDTRQSAQIQEMHSGA